MLDSLFDSWAAFCSVTILLMARFAITVKIITVFKQNKEQRTNKLTSWLEKKGEILYSQNNDAWNHPNDNLSGETQSCCLSSDYITQISCYTA
jgi:16S rRNA C1402 (ribose-2'-O) methylase RsmI